MTDINWPEAFAYYSARLADMWPGKVAVGTALSSLCLLLGMDEVLFYVLLATLTGEMLTRIAVHCKRNKSLCRGLQHGLARYICYGLFLLMAVAVQMAFQRAVGVGLPIVDIFMAYLILTDCASVIGHLYVLGIPVPGILKTLVVGGRRRLEHAVREAVHDDEVGTQHRERP